MRSFPLILCPAARMVCTACHPPKLRSQTIAHKFPSPSLVYTRLHEAHMQSLNI